MLSRWQFGFLLVVAATTLALMIANMVLFSRNRSQQTEVNNRQLYIQQTAQFEGLYQQLIRTLADLSTRTNDADLGAILTKQGISFSPAAAPKPAEAAAPVKGAARK